MFPPLLPVQISTVPTPKQLPSRLPPMNYGFSYAVIDLETAPTQDGGAIAGDEPTPTAAAAATAVAAATVVAAGPMSTEDPRAAVASAGSGATAAAATAAVDGPSSSSAGIAGGGDDAGNGPSSSSTDPYTGGDKAAAAGNVGRADSWPPKLVEPAAHTTKGGDEQHGTDEAGGYGLYGDDVCRMTTESSTGAAAEGGEYEDSDFNEAGAQEGPEEASAAAEEPESPELLTPTREEFEAAPPNPPRAPTPIIPDLRTMTPEQLEATAGQDVSNGGQVRFFLCSWRGGSVVSVFVWT